MYKQRWWCWWWWMKRKYRDCARNAENRHFLCILLPKLTHTNYNSHLCIYMSLCIQRTCVCANCMRDRCWYSLPDMSKCSFLSLYLVVANRTYVFAREHSTHFPCTCSPSAGRCRMLYVSLRLPLFRGMRLRRQNVLSHTCKAPTYWLASRHPITSIHVVVICCDVM